MHYLVTPVFKLEIYFARARFTNVRYIFVSGVLFLFTFIAMAFRGCPAKYCGSVVSLNLWGRLLPDSLNSPKSTPRF